MECITPFFGSQGLESTFDPLNSTKWPVLQFEDGKLSGIEYRYHYDFIDALHDELFEGTNYDAWGGVYYTIATPQGPMPALGGLYIHGKFIFSVPESSTIILLVLGLIGILFIQCMRGKIIHSLKSRLILITISHISIFLKRYQH
jgi:hypothetical protein